MIAGRGGTIAASDLSTTHGLRVPEVSHRRQAGASRRLLLLIDQVTKDWTHLISVVAPPRWLEIAK